MGPGLHVRGPETRSAHIKHRVRNLHLGGIPVGISAVSVSGVGTAQAITVLLHSFSSVLIGYCGKTYSQDKEFVSELPVSAGSPNVTTAGLHDKVSNVACVGVF